MVMVPDRPQEANGLITITAEQLSRGDVASRRGEARLLLALALGREDSVFPHEDIVFDAAAATRLDMLVDRRNQGEPLSRLRGWREFYSLRFGLNAATLDPRPDSEVVVETALALATELSPQIDIIDLGTGSGCLLLALLHHLPQAQGLGVDINPDAIAAARDNAKSLGLEDRVKWLASDWDCNFGKGQFDIVVSNPPYIPSNEIEGLEAEVNNHDPRIALDGGEDGLAAWRVLLPILAGKLKPWGRGLVEIGCGQDDIVSTLGRSAGLETISTHADLAGRTRCLVFAKAV
jgi:release factor glutamine methyltransferase